jgi:hypothetical protein
VNAGGSARNRRRLRGGGHGKGLRSPPGPESYATTVAGGRKRGERVTKSPCGRSDDLTSTGRPMMGTEITEAYDWRGRLGAEGEKLGKVRNAHIETESDTER